MKPMSSSIVDENEAPNVLFNSTELSFICGGRRAVRILRSSNHELPDLMAALHSSDPVTKFVLEMQGGKKGLIVNSTDICKGKHLALANFDAQNGRLHDYKPVVKAKCGGKKGRAR
jgi:hypothetical protein